MRVSVVQNRSCSGYTVLAKEAKERGPLLNLGESGESGDASLIDLTRQLTRPSNEAHLLGSREARLRRILNSFVLFPRRNNIAVLSARRICHNTKQKPEWRRKAWLFHGFQESAVTGAGKSTHRQRLVLLWAKLLRLCYGLLSCSFLGETLKQFQYLQPAPCTATM